jgi:hypothetical protein
MAQVASSSRVIYHKSTNFDRLAKSLLANEIERFWKKIRDERSVKIANCLRALARVFAI